MGLLRLLPGERIFADENGRPLFLVRGPAGKSGRRKLEVVDWDGNMGDRQGKTVLLKNMGPLDDGKISGHTSSPTTVDWDGNGVPDLLVGPEDGRLYYKLNPRTD